MWNGWSLSDKNTVTDWLSEAVINGFLRLVKDVVCAHDDNVSKITLMKEMVEAGKKTHRTYK